MRSINKVLLTGHLVRDPQEFSVGTAKKSLFSIGVNKSFNDKEGKLVEKTSFLDVEVWGNQQVFCQSYLKKGRHVFVEGELVKDSWQKDDVWHDKTYVKAFDVQALGAPSEKSNETVPGTVPEVVSGVETGAEAVGEAPKRGRKPKTDKVEAQENAEIPF